MAKKLATIVKESISYTSYLLDEIMKTVDLCREKSIRLDTDELIHKKFISCVFRDTDINQEDIDSMVFLSNKFRNTFSYVLDISNPNTIEAMIQLSIKKFNIHKIKSNLK